MRDQDIDAFFSWFAANSAGLTNASQNPDLVATLEQRLDVLNSDFAWEIGPGNCAEWSFSLSPDGDEALSDAVRHAISRAPKIPRWEFHAFRQPRDAEPIVELESAKGTVEVDASAAEYVLLRARDGTFDMLVRLPAAAELQRQDQYALAVLLLDGLVGEEVRMSLIKNVEFVEEFESRYQGRTTKLKHLRRHLNQQAERERGSRSTQ